MNRRERVKRAFHFDRPDRVPMSAFNLDSDFYPISAFEPISWQPTEYPPHVDGGAITFSHIGFRKNIYDWDKEIREKAGYPENWWAKPHDSIDEFGVIWRSSGTKSDDKTMGHPYKGPFNEDKVDIWDKLDNFEFPNAADPQRYKIIKSGRWKSLAEDRYLIGDLGSGGLFNRGFQMRGFNNFLIDLARNNKPKKIQQLIDSILSFYLIQTEKMKQCCSDLDSIMIADDFGTQKSAFISPRIFSKFFKEPYRKLINLTHDLGMDFILHSCGDVLALIPEFIDAGVDVLEFDSPHMTGVENFKHWANKRKLAFWLSSNIQSTYILGTPKDVEEEIKYYIKEIGNNEGGLAIFEYPSNKSIGTPTRNIRAQRKAVLKWGNYNTHGVIDWLT